MSTTAGALDRATLDSKDRAELQTIAQAMGGKPGSRLRKAEIVDLILDLAGGGGAAKAPSSSSRSSAKADKSDAEQSDTAESKPAKAKKSDSSTKSDDDAGSLFDADETPADTNGSSGAYGTRSRGRRDMAPSSDAESEKADDNESSDDRRDASGRSSKGKDDDRDSDGPDAKNDDSDDDAKNRDSGGKDSDSKDSDGKDSDKRDARGRDSDRDSKGRDSKDRDSKGRSDKDGDDKSDEGDRGSGNRGGRDGGRGDGEGRNRGRDGQNRDGQNRDGQNRDGQNRDGQKGDGQKGGRNNRDRNNNNRNNRNNNNREEQTEAGNRRRRRRGGGRDRDDEPVVPWDGEPIPVEGFLDLRPDGYGFLRVNGSLASNADVYVPVKTARAHGLRRGDLLKGKSRPANKNEKNPALLELEEVNGGPVEKAKARPKFEDLTPLFPDDKLRLERPDDAGNMTTRIIDLISPIGKGQRGLIVSPPKAGKTTIVKEIVRSIEVNNPEVKVLVLLVDERPEEVTDMRRWLVRGEVIASTFDRPSDEHTAVAEMTIERAKRMVEFGEDVVIVLDGITRLARAYNLAAPSTGRIMSGGVDSGALYPPKRFFGAARNVEEGGSLTILATALIETGSKMDEVIFEEFKGTGNMELRLDRRTAERRIYPAIDVDASSTRHEELLFDRKELNQVWKLRRVLTGMANDEDNGRGNAAGLELLIDRLKTFATNNAFLDEVARGPVG